MSSHQHRLKIGLLMAFLVISLSAHAQGDFMLGTKIGFVTSEVEGSEWDRRESLGSLLIDRNGFECGVVLNWRFSSLFYAKAELVYLQKGAVITEGINFTFPVNAELDYVNIPFTIGISPISENKLFNISAEAGAGANFKIRSEEISRESPYETNSTFSYHVGGEASFLIANDLRLYANFRYWRDINAFYSRTATGPIDTNTYDLRHFGISVTAGVYFILD